LDFLEADWLIRRFGPFGLLGVAAVVVIETGFIVLSLLHSHDAVSRAYLRVDRRRNPASKVTLTGASPGGP
jgi:hypothetical protein